VLTFKKNRRRAVGYYTRVLSKEAEFPPLDELALVLADHPGFKLTVEEGSEEEWEILLLAGDDGAEIALLERNTVDEGSLGQDEIGQFMEELQEAKPESAARWLEEYLAEVKTIFAFQHLQGAELVEGGNALNALRAALWERGDAIIQADGEGFTNESGHHITWQFSESVSGPWNMAVLQDGTWLNFRMDLGDPDHREAFLNGEVPDDAGAA
jgi:hypothetical protein